MRQFLSVTFTITIKFTIYDSTEKPAADLIVSQKKIMPMFASSTILDVLLNEDGFWVHVLHHQAEK